MNPIIVRPATLADLPTLLTFEEGIILTERPFDKTLLEGKFHYYDIGAMITDDNAAVIVAESSGELVGSGSAIIKPGNTYNQHEHFAHLGFMFVKPEHRGKGINQAIIQALRDWSATKGLSEIRLQVYAENENAIKAYEKVGFKKLLTEMRLDV